MALCSNPASVGNGASTSISYGGLCGGASPTPTPSPTATPVPTPTPSITPGPVNTTVYPADQFRASFGVNMSYDEDGTNYSVMPSPGARATSDPTPLAYIKTIGGTTGVQFVRDGTGVLGYNISNYNLVWNQMYAGIGVQVEGSNVSSYTLAQIQTVPNNAVFGLEPINEWDVFTLPTYVATQNAANYGTSTITTQSSYYQRDLIPGSLYCFQDAKPECFNVGWSTTPATGAVLLPNGSFMYPHSSSTTIIAGTNNYNQMLSWGAWMAGPVRYYQPTFPIICPALAFPRNAQQFTQPALAGLCSVGNLHDYPEIAANPGGPTGDGSESYQLQGDGPCSWPPGNGTLTSYGFGYNTCSMAMEMGLANPQQYVFQGSVMPIPVWTTETSYHVEPIGDAYTTNSYAAIPDDTAVKYLARRYLFGFTHNRSLQFWFQMMDGTDAPTGGFCTYGMIRVGGNGNNQCHGNAATPDPLYISAPKAEFQAFQTLARYSYDSGCHYPTCALGVSNINITWSDPTLPLQEVNLKYSNGDLAVWFWQEGQSYNNHPPSPSPATTPTGCIATTSCYFSVPTRSETVVIPFMTSAVLSGLSSNGSDPTAAPTTVPAYDGTPENVSLCPITSVTQNCFGGLLPSTSLTVTNPGTANASVSVTSTDTPMVIRASFSGATPVPTPSAPPTSNPVSPNPSPSLYPGLPTATAPPAPPTPIPSFGIVGAPTIACSSNVAPNKTFSFALNQTAAFGDWLIVGVQQGGSTTPTNQASVNVTTPVTFETPSPGPTPIYSGGNFGQAGLFYKVAQGGETSVTMTNSGSNTFNYCAELYEVSHVLSIQAAISTVTSVVAASPTITAISPMAYAIGMYGLQNTDSGAAAGLSASLGTAGYTPVSVPVSSLYAGAANNIVGYSAYDLMSGAAPGSGQQTATIAGTNLAVSNGTAAMVVVNAPTPTPTATPAFGTGLSVTPVAYCPTSAAPATTVTCAFGTGIPGGTFTPTNGMKLVAFISAVGGTFMAQDNATGWTYLTGSRRTYGTGFNGAVIMNTKTSAGTETSFSITDATAQEMAITIVEVSHFGTQTNDNSSTAVSGNATNSASSFSPPAGGDLAVIAYTFNNANTGPPTGLSTQFSLSPNFPNVGFYPNSNWYPSTPVFNTATYSLGTFLPTQIVTWGVAPSTAQLIVNWALSGTNANFGTPAELDFYFVSAGAGP